MLVLRFKRKKNVSTKSLQSNKLLEYIMKSSILHFSTKELTGAFKELQTSSPLPHVLLKTLSIDYHSLASSQSLPNERRPGLLVSSINQHSKIFSERYWETTG